MSRVFLTAEWRYLAMLNYRVSPALLLPHVPAGTELDSWRGDTYLSILGLLFQNTRVLGVTVPFHRDFEEVNLRFYVRREVSGAVRRGVTFVREIVPRRAVATVARLIYNEPYQTLGMSHRLDAMDPATGAPLAVEYAWRQKNGWSRLAVSPSGPAESLRSGSIEEFITEHHCGYTRQRDGGTIEYRVEHPRWKVWPVSQASVEGDLGQLYGPTIAQILNGKPDSAFLADGSAVSVHVPSRIHSSGTLPAAGTAGPRS